MKTMDIARDPDRHNGSNNLYTHIEKELNMGYSNAWAIGYVQAFHNIGLIDTKEYNKLLELIHITK